MSGKPRDPEYFRKWRAAHPEYRERERSRMRSRDRGDRASEYRRYNAKRASRAEPPLVHLFPWLTHGSRVSFWDDELKMDCEQEYALAMLEGRDPIKAVAEYRARETSWYKHVVPLAAWR